MTTSGRDIVSSSSGFAIDQGAVTNGEYSEFVADGGYERRELWTEAGWAWREAERAERPLYWTAADGLERRFDRVEQIAGDLPVMHVSCFEAEAYARWAGGRLPASRSGSTRRSRWTPAATATSTSSTSARVRPGRSSATAGSGRQPSSPATPASAPSPTPSTPRPSSTPATGCCAAPRGRHGRASRAPRSATGTIRSGARSSLASAVPTDRRDPDDRRDHDRALRAQRRARLAGRRGARRAQPQPQGAAAEVLLRRARLAAVRRDHDAARVLPDALRARDPQPAGAGDRRRERRRRAGRAGLGHRVEDARAALRDGGRRHAAPLRAVRRRRLGRRSVRRRADRALSGTRGARRRRRLRPRPRPHPRRRAGGCSPSSAARSATSIRTSGPRSSRAWRG